MHPNLFDGAGNGFILKKVACAARFCGVDE